MLEKSNFKTAVMWFCVGHIQSFRNMERLELVRIAEAASELQGREPMWMAEGTFDITGYASDLSGANVTAVLVSAIWVLQGESEELTDALLNDWPDLPLFAMLA